MKTLPLSFISLFIALLTSCSSPSTPTLILTLKALPHLNSNNKQESFPVVVTFYQLTELTKFESANYFSLLDAAETVLSPSLIQKHEIEIRPNQQLIQKISLAPGCKYIGVFAAFRDVEKSHWKETIDLGKETIENFAFSLQNFTLKKQP